MPEPALVRSLSHARDEISRWRDVRMDGYLDGSTDDYAGRMEVIESRTGRRVRSEVERARIAAESLASGTKVVDVARRQEVNRWQATSRLTVP